MANPETARDLIAQRLKAAREQAGLSQGQAAKLLEFHRPTVSEIEAGHRRVAADELARFSELYGVSVGWIMGQWDEPDLSDPQLAVVARELKKLKPDDIGRVRAFIATVQRDRSVGGE